MALALRPPRGQSVMILVLAIKTKSLVSKANSLAFVCHVHVLTNFCTVFNTLIMTQPFDAHCCHMVTTIKHPVPYWVKPSIVIFDIRAL